LERQILHFRPFPSDTQDQFSATGGRLHLTHGRQVSFSLLADDNGGTQEEVRYLPLPNGMKQVISSSMFRSKRFLSFFLSSSSPLFFFFKVN
jgi:hypothetical protein